MRRKFTYMFEEKIYLDDILQISTGSSKVGGFRLSIRYISDYFRSVGDPDPRFYRNNYYDTQKQRNRALEKLKKSMEENGNAIRIVA